MTIDDVGEAVDRVAVAVDHGGRAVGRPEAGLAGPVRLDDVRHDDEQRVGVGGLRGEQRLGRLAQAGLVGEQEGPVAGRGRGDQLRLVRHQLQAARRVAARSGSGRAMHAEAPPPARSNELKQRAEQLPAGQAARTGVALGAADEKSGARKGLASCRETTDCGTTRRSVGGGRRAPRALTSSGADSMPGGPQHARA